METTKHYSLRLVAAILSIAIALMSLPLTVFADELGRLFENQETEAVAEKEPFEVLEKRTATSKTFSLEDGSFYIAQYDSDIHYLDESGAWQEIDNTLTAHGSEISTKNAKIKFAKKTNGSNKIFTIHNGNQKLTLSLIGANKKITGKITNHQSEFDAQTTKLEKMTTLDHVNATVRYEEILRDTDLEYIVSGVNIKENIIVKNRQDSYRYSFEMCLNNLTAELTEKGEIQIFNSSAAQPVYLIPAPVMWDSARSASEAVCYELSNHGNGKYTLTVVADATWMNESDRAFPVTIDPPIYTSNSTSVVDLDISTALPNKSSPNDASIYVSETWRAYWKLTTLPTLPASAYITEAKFTMDCFTSSSMNGYVAAYDVLTDWQSDLTYAMTVAADNPKGVPAADFTDFQELNCSDMDGYGSYYLNNYWGYYWNITSIVKKWYEGQNYGVMFAPATGTTFTGIAQFRSDNYSNVAKRPQLCITYRDMKGLEDYWSYTGQSAGFAGIGSVNNATGSLVFAIPTLTSTDALMPFTPTLVYNSAIAGKSYTYSNVQTSYWGSYTPRGFKLNIHETLLKKSYTDKDGTTKYLFIWADSDGTEHYFLPTTTENTYADEDGLLLTLFENTTVSPNVCTITDSNRNIKTFSKLSSQPSGTVSGWYLSSVADLNGNKLTFGFESGPRPTSVNLVPKYSSAIEQLRIAYDNNYNPYIVWNPASNEAVILRYSQTATGSISTASSNYLRQVVHVHGTQSVSQTEWRAFYDSNSNIDTSKIKVDAIAEYNYDNYGKITTVTNELTQYRIEYGYDSSKRVTSVKEWAVGTTNMLGQQLSLTYGSSSTVIRTSGTDDIFNTADDLLTTYGFDPEGRAITCYTTDLNRTQVYGASYGEYVGEDNEKAKNNLKSSVQTTQQSSNYLLNGGFEKTATNSIPYWNTTGTAKGGYGIEYEGQSCATLTVNTNTTTSSIYQYVNLDKGDYSLSMYINTHETQGVKVYLKAESLSNSAHSVVQEVPVNEYYATVSYAFFALNFSSSPSTNNGKEMFKISVVVSGAPTKEAENIWVDNIMLSKTTGSAEYDMMSMGHFESTYYAPQSFWKILDREDESITVVDSGIPAFGDVLKIDINLNEYEFVRQVVYQATDSMKSEYDEGYYSDGNEPWLFTVSGWGKGTAQGYAGTSLFGIRVEIQYYDGSQYGKYESYDFDFDKGITDWQFLSGGFATNPAKGMIDTITIMIMYNDHPGVGYFDNISLVKDSSTTEIYDYNQRGYLTSYQNGWKRSWCAYNDSDQLIRTVSTDRTVIDYEYDSYNRVKKEYHKKYTGSLYCSPNTIENNPNDVKTNFYYSYGYNTYGQQYYVWTYDGSTPPKDTSTFTYYNTQKGSHIFGTVDYKYDELGRTTRYFYNETNGRLLAVTYPEGNGVCYSYDAIGNLIEVLPAVLLTTEIEHEEYNEYEGSYTWTEYLYDYDADVNSNFVNYEYDSATQRLSNITTYSTEYKFVYDAFGNTTNISAGDHSLAEYEYNGNNGKLNTLTYGNGLEVRYVYDKLDRISEICYNIGENNAFETVYSYTYDTAGNIFSITDHLNHEATVFKYDSQGKLDKSYVYDTETYLNLYGNKVYYDDNSRVSMVFHYMDYSCPADNYHGTTYSNSSHYSYSYNNETGNIFNMSLSGDAISGNVKPQYDSFGRITQKVVDVNINTGSDFYEYSRVDAFYEKTTYQYTERYGRQTGQIESIVKEIRKGENTSLISSTTYKYTYDQNGNITQIADASNVIQNKYYYDDLGQLIREDNRANGYSYVYQYDDAGNITAKKRYAFTTGALGSVQYTYNYSYNDSSWGDLLTDYAWDHIEYDEIGNPIKIGYYNEEYDYWESGYELSWSGRQLTSYAYFENYDNEGLCYDTQIIFTYNADGIRTSKTVDGIEHRYYLDGSQITAEMWTQNGVEYLLYYLYDETGSPLGMQYRTSNYASGTFDFYFFEKNLQGDVVGIYNSNGVKICTYKYDAWGSCSVSMTSGISSLDRYVANIYNPFRYRGYYYDVQTGYYYLQSRYYNPNWGRFLNADSQINTNGLVSYNMFAYCNNNPVMLVDPDGHLPFFVITAAIGAVAGAIIGGCIAASRGENVWAGIGIGAAAGGLVGLGAGAAAGALLAGSVTASTAAVATGAGTLATTVATGGVGAGAAYVANNVSQAASNFTSDISLIFNSVPSNPGVDFVPGKTGYQYGVNPNTLIPSKDLSTLDPQRIANAVKYAGDQLIRVGRTGIILDGHHRVADAIANGRAIDVFVEFFK